jgi:hypothetical protein
MAWLPHPPPQSGCPIYCLVVYVNLMKKFGLSVSPDKMNFIPDMSYYGRG